MNRRRVWISFQELCLYQKRERMVATWDVVLKGVLWKAEMQQVEVYDLGEGWGPLIWLSRRKGWARAEARDTLYS